MVLKGIHGRAHELTLLNAATDLAKQGEPQLTVLMGRRRVGKTFLVQHHLNDLTGATPCYRAATRLSESDEIALCWEALRTSLPSLRDQAEPRRWSDLFDALVDAALQQPVVLALDEVPYLVESSSSFATELQRSWDRARHLARPPLLHLILTGSALSTISELLSSRGALFERPNQVIRLEPFDLPTSASYLRIADGTSAIETFAATGGYPLLLDRWDTAAPAEENLIRLAGDPTGALATNASTMLLDLPNAQPYLRVMSAVGRGASKFSEISSHAGTRIERPLTHLNGTGYLTQSRPIGDQRAAPIYELADQYLRFWFAVVERDIQLIEAGQGEAVIRAAAPRWNGLLADTFEREARAHLVRLVRRGALDSDMLIGRWWTHRPRQIELDAVGLRGNNWALIGEAKWSQRFSRADLNQLLAARDALSQAEGARLALFARTTFAPEVIEATEGALHLTASDLL